MLTTLFKGVMYEIREKDGATAALEFHERIWKREDRVKNMTATLKEVFKIEGNDIEAIKKWWEIYWELIGTEGTTVELSETLWRSRIPVGCAWKTEPEDISEWMVIFADMVGKTINPKYTLERTKAMCEGDPYSEYVGKIKKEG